MGTIIDLSTQLKKNISDEEMFTRTHFDTELIRLQNYDNFYSLMDRLHQLDSSNQGMHRLLLVWPPRGKILETPLEFGRLRGWAVRNQYEIALVIPGDDVSRSMALEQGIPAYRSIKEASESEWQPVRGFPKIEDPQERGRSLALMKKDVEQAQQPKTPFAARFLFFLLALAVLGFVFYAIIPQARVEITPYLIKKTITMSIWTDDRLDTPTLAGGIPTLEKSLELTLSAEIPASGQVKIESGIAIGEIRVRNTCDRVYASSAGAIIGTSEDFDTGINFLTLEDATLDPGEERTIRIEAEISGEAGNLPAGSIRYAQYPKSLCWEVTQEKPTAGGSSGVYPAPTDADRQAARQMITDMVQETALAALANDPDGQDLLPLGEAVITSVRQDQMQPDPGFAADTLTLRETVTVTFKAIRKSDMEAIIRGQSARMNMQSAGLIGYEILSGPQEENGLTAWTIRADYLVYEPVTNEEAIQTMLRGKTLPQAYAVLNSLEHVKSTSITLLPSNYSHLPLAAQNIRVTIHPALEAEP